MHQSAIHTASNQYTSNVHNMLINNRLMVRIRDHRWEVHGLACHTPQSIRLRDLSRFHGMQYLYRQLHNNAMCTCAPQAINESHHAWFSGGGAICRQYA